MLLVRYLNADLRVLYRTACMQFCQWCLNQIHYKNASQSAKILRVIHQLYKSHHPRRDIQDHKTKTARGHDLLTPWRPSVLGGLTFPFRLHSIVCWHLVMSACLCTLTTKLQSFGVWGCLCSDRFVVDPKAAEYLDWSASLYIYIMHWKVKRSNQLSHHVYMITLKWVAPLLYTINMKKNWFVEVQPVHTGYYYISQIVQLI